jgi:hypothetical protein
MRLRMNTLRKVGSATGKEIQGLFVFSVLMQKHVAPQQLARCLDFHFSINTERFQASFSTKKTTKDYKLSTTRQPFTQVGASD